MAIPQLVAIDDFLIDCSLSETHTFDSDVTEYPVESGSNITDNIRPLPIEVEMECLVSNTPIGIITNHRTLIRGEGEDQNISKPVDDAYDLLILIRDQRKPVTIRTSLRTYENMALKSLSIPRSGKTGDALMFTAKFQQIIMVENKRTVRVSTPIGNNKKKVTKPPNDSAASQILIDPVYHVWFDPDFGRWRKSYIFAKWVDHDTSNTVSYTRHRFNLFRGPMMPVSFRVSGPWIPPMILVPISNCQLHDFSIKTPFNGIIRPFERQTTLAGRTQ